MQDKERHTEYERRKRLLPQMPAAEYEAACKEIAKELGL